MPDWQNLDPFHTLGLNPAQSADAGVQSIPSVGRSAGPGLLNGHTKPWHPDNPLFWFGSVALVTFGLIGASTQIRIGPLKASASAGKK